MSTLDLNDFGRELHNTGSQLVLEEHCSVLKIELYKEEDSYFTERNIANIFNVNIESSDTIYADNDYWFFVRPVKTFRLNNGLVFENISLMVEQNTVSFHLDFAKAVFPKGYENLSLLGLVAPNVFIDTIMALDKRFIGTGVKKLRLN